MIDFVAIEKPQDLLGMVVISKRGRDEGKLYVIIGWLPDDFALVADGRRRAADKPKKKNMKHLVYTDFRSEEIWMRRQSNEIITNKMLKSALAAYARA